MGGRGTGWRTAFASIYLASVATAGCSDPSILSGGRVGACKKYNACAVVTSADVSAAAGTKFLPGKEGDSNPNPSVELAEVVTCVFDTVKPTDPFVSVSIRCCPCGDNNPAAAAQSFGGVGMTVTSVSGVGDSALWVEMNPDAGGPIIDQLVVFVGADFQVIVSIDIPLGQMFTFDPLGAAKRIADVALLRL